MNVVAIVQARLGSTRFPQKIFADVIGKSLIWHVINRLKYSKKINNIILATTDNDLDDNLVKWANLNDVNIFRGSEDNVLERFYLAAEQSKADVIVRITADDPFKDPEIIDSAIEKLLDEKMDFICNNNPPSFPEGLDTEVFTFDALKKAYLNANDDFEKEHVTQFFYRNKNLFKQGNISNDIDLSYLRWTIDTEIDFEMVKLVYKDLYKENGIFLMNDILSLINKNPMIAEINKKVARSDMYK